MCFHVLGFFPDGRARLSRRSAQEQALDHILQSCRPGDILPAVVTGLAPFGAFCDIGCGVPALLGLREICVSRIQHPSDCLHIGQQLYTVLRSLDPALRCVWLTQRELLGTWEENAARFRPGQTVAGVVRARQPYGVFISLTPNLSGLAAPDDTLQPGQPVCVFIKAIQPETLKIKLCVLHTLDSLPVQPLRYTKTEGHLNTWRYGSPALAKVLTIF